MAMVEWTESRKDTRVHQVAGGVQSYLARKAK